MAHEVVAGYASEEEESFIAFDTEHEHNAKIYYFNGSP